MFNSEKFYDKESAIYARAYLGEKGWFSCNRIDRNNSMPYGTLSSITLEHGKSPFNKNGNDARWAVFYPDVEDTREEWIKRNNVKVGTKVRINDKKGDTVRFYWDAHMFKRLRGKEGMVRVFSSSMSADFINVMFPLDGDWNVPFSILEVVPEPKYVPFKTVEEIFDANMTGKIENDSGEYRDWAILPTNSNGEVQITLAHYGAYIVAGGLDFMFKNYKYRGHPFGRKVDA